MSNSTLQKRLMLDRFLPLLGLFVLLTGAGAAGLDWKALPNLPGELGVAGPFAGVHNNTLIVAGGANFPEGVPWRKTVEGFNSPKIYYDTIHLITKEGYDYKITEAARKLPRALGYGISISTASGVICIGGEWKTNVKDEAAKKFNSTLHHSSKVFALGIDEDKVTVNENYPSLPKGTTAAAGTLIGKTIYVIGGDSGQGATKNFWSLDLTKQNTTDFRWKKLTPWNGPARTHLLASPQNDGGTDCLYIFSGRMKDDQDQWHILSDAHKYNPQTEEWKKLNDIQPMGDGRPRSVMAGTVAPIGANHLLVLGGANGKRFITLEGLSEQIAAAKAAGNQQAAAELKKEQQRMQDNHVGFSRDILLYNTVTDRWTRYAAFKESARMTGSIPIGSHVTTTAVNWGDSIIIPSGESSPGIRTPNIWKIDLTKSEHTFGAANWTVLVVYMGVLIGMGFWFSRRSKTPADFFIAGKRVVWWAAGLSIFSTQLSAITYLSIPAKAFSTNWTWFILNMTIPLMVPVIVFCFLPFYRRLNITSVYEYLEMRFSGGLRKLGSASFAVFHLCRMGIVILLPAMALSAVTGWDVRWCIIAMGLLSTLYTVLGGIEAVIWTDVLQTIVLVGGAFAAVVIIAGQIDGGWGAIFQVATEQGKLKMMQPEWNFSSGLDSIWVIVIGGIFIQILSYGTDQSVVQRYFTTPTEKDAAKAIWTNGLLCIPASILFFAVGTVLYVYFQQQPARLEPIDKIDQIFPYFIVSQMPAGLAGLVIAGVFAAAMSSLDSSMHSIATAVTTDFLSGRKTEKGGLLKLAKLITFTLGVLGTVSALIIAAQDNKNLWDTLMGYIGLILGTLGGLFTLAIFTNRTASIHAWIGVIATAAVLWYVKFQTDINSLIYGAIGTVTCFVVGFLASYIIPAKPNKLTGLTWAFRSTNAD